MANEAIGGGLPAGGDPKMHRPPDSKLPALLTLERAEGGGPEEDFHRLQCRDRHAGTCAVLRGMGQQVSAYREILECQLGGAVDLLQIFS